MGADNPSTSEKSVALVVGGQTERNWRFCEWIASPGKLCRVPAGVGRTDGLAVERFCAYHQHRARLSTYGAYMSEHRAFLDWVAQFDAGTSYQPMPGIWDGDRELLWQLVSGDREWASFMLESRVRKQEVR